ncbi:MAG TPA: CdaR family protein [Acetivibrio sp.]|nr:CdaR family protein [Acetivibrio sp.]
MSELLKKDTTVKILSVIFAVFLWYFVLDSTNPVEWIDLNIPLSVENADALKSKGIIIKDGNFPRTVSVRLKGRKSKINTVSQNDFEAILDLSKINEADIRHLQIDVRYQGIDVFNYKGAISFQGVTPRRVDLKLEKVGENSFPVKVNITGTPRENYKVISANAVPATVSIEAADDVVDSIGEVCAYVDVTNMSSNTVRKSECVFYDDKGEEIVELSGKHSVDISLEFAKEVPIVPTIIGRPAKNYSDGIHRVIPEKALITGAADTIELIDNLKTEPIDIENMSASTTKIVNLDLPEGVRLFDTQRSVYVDVVIEPVAVKEINVDKDNVLLENAQSRDIYKYEILDDDIIVSITGIQQEIEKITAGNLRLSIDVRGLGEGTYKRPLKAALPDTVKLLQDYEVEVRIRRVN